MDIESSYQQTKKTAIKRFVRISPVMILGPLLCLIMSLIFTQLVAAVTIGESPATFFDSFKGVYLKPTIIGLSIGFVISVGGSVIAYMTQPKLGSYSITKLSDISNGRSVGTSYGSFALASKDNDGYVLSSTAKYPENPLLNEYRIDEKIEKSGTNWNLVQDVTETPLGMWNKTMKAVEDEVNR